MVSSRKRRLAKGRRSTRHSSATNRSVPTVSAPSVVLETKYGRHGLAHLAEMISQEDDDWEQVPALWKWDSDSDDSEFVDASVSSVDVLVTDAGTGAEQMGLYTSMQPQAHRTH